MSRGRANKMQERVTLRGVLRGKNAEALCTVKATRLGVLAAHEVDPQSIDVLSPKSIPVPDGNYDLVLEGKYYHVRLEKGHMLCRGF
jgi:hypothetical protein